MSDTQNSPEIEALKSIYAAINRNDVAATLPYLDPQIERIEPTGFPLAGTYRGSADVIKHIIQGRSTWAEGFCNPERFLVSGDKVVAFLHARVTMKKDSKLVEGRFADGFVFRNGKIILMRTFGERDEALAWAGIPGVETGS